MSGEWKEIVAKWQGNQVFIGYSSTGREIQMGSLKEQPGISPMEMLLLALAGCTGMDITLILEKKRISLKDMQVKVRAKRAENYPQVYKEIEVTYLLWGEDIPPKAVEQAIRLSEEKYCSVGIMLGESATINSTYHIYAAGQPAE